MDTAEANKFINALVKNLQALCHGHVSFNNSIQVIGHLYLNVDSDVNIDYIVNEKVSKNDTSSTVFVSKSYHSEPKDDKKQLANANNQKQNPRNIPASPPYHHGNLNTDKMKNQRRRFEPGLEIRNINPAYREDKFSGYQDSGSPQKFPRMSMGFRDKQRLPKTVVETKVVPHRNETVNVIDLCDIKDEPGTDSVQEQYNTSDVQQEFDMSHGEGTNQDSFSEQFPTDPMSPTPIALHLNQNFPQFQDPNNSSSSSPYAGVADSQMSQDPNYKKEQCQKLISYLDGPRDIRTLRPVTRKTYDTLISLTLGEFNTPVKLRTSVERNAVKQFWRSNGKYSVSLVNGERMLLFKGKPVIIQDNV